MKGHLTSLLLLLVAVGDARAQRPVNLNIVKQLDTGMQVCEQESAFEVRMHDGLIPELEIRVVLKPAPDSLNLEIPLWIELLDAQGRLIELADSSAGPVGEEPPWRFQQAEGEGRYVFELRNRRPKTAGPGQRYKIRVSLDSSKTQWKETKPFWLYWPELGQQFCKRNP